MKRLFTILSALSLIVTACHKDPYADAIIAPNPAYVGEDITFTNISSNADYVEWELGDGTTSSAVNVSHYYIDPDLYDVKLRAFGTKGGVNTASFMVEVIGAELKIVVRLWTPPDQPDGYLLPGASVILYSTLKDWEDQTHPVVQYINGQVVTELFTNGVGECTFADLSYQNYYVDVWDQNHNNYTLASEDLGWIETQLLEGAYYQTFVAYVDYFADGKKSAFGDERADRMIEPGSATKERALINNKISTPRK